MVEYSPLGMDWRRIGRLLRLVLGVSFLFFFLWLLDREVVFGSSRSVSIERFDRTNPIVSVDEPDALLAYTTAAGAARWRIGRPVIHVSIKPPRAFRDLELRFGFANHGAEAARLVHTSPDGQPVTTLFWDKRLPDWPAASAGGVTLLQRPVKKNEIRPQFDSLEAFFKGRPILSDVGTYLLSPPLGQAVTDLREVDQLGVNYLFVPTPQVSSEPDWTVESVALHLSDVVNTGGSYRFALVVDGVQPPDQTIDLISLKATLRGDALTPAKLWQILQRWGKKT